MGKHGEPYVYKDGDVPCDIPYKIIKDCDGNELFDDCQCRGSDDHHDRQERLVICANALADIENPAALPELLDAIGSLVLSSKPVCQSDIMPIIELWGALYNVRYPEAPNA